MTKHFMVQIPLINGTLLCGPHMGKFAIHCELLRIFEVNNMYINSAACLNSFSIKLRRLKFALSHSLFKERRPCLCFICVSVAGKGHVTKTLLA